MNDQIAALEPRGIWKHFLSLSGIPRPSGHEDAIRAFLAGFGRSLGLETIVDEAGNVIIRKPATSGMEDRQGVILQAHFDMVPQKNSDIVHDFEKDPIDIFVEAGQVRARGTTLGADNGIGVAAIMEVLESGRMCHGPLEALLTSNEESGMTGAFGLKPGLLRGTILLNLDSEDEGIFSIGCAGGLDATMTFPYQARACPEGYAGFTLHVSGLKGGHSGIDINRGRGNANKIMNRLLYACHARYGVLLASIEGGSLRNAIPRESRARVAVPTGNAKAFIHDVMLQAAAIKQELVSADPLIRIDAVPAALPVTVLDESVLVRLLRAVYACPDGVMHMSREVSGMVETSNNLAVVQSCDDVVKVECLLRSSVDSARDDLASMIRSVFDLAGAVSVFHGGYPGWKPDPDSAILGRMQEIYRRKFGENPDVRVVHAGLECGIIGSVYPALDMISFGPTIRYPHSPDETVDIASVAKFRDVLVETLARIPTGHSLPLQ